ncbi:glycoside hydrolase family 140 protein [Paenibacillus sp.]|uniref:glycoside hydrolase family 140 protein n=1 Tax=Paenibacillus sp. TaxID=58172 RepID=UPI002811E7C4|nr:glycoside hydrolase family 140 protein [Paenibacillus sp.]
MTEKKLQRLRVSENRRFLEKEDGTPFFWLGDTAWELFHKLDREEAELYLRNRAERGFTVVQAVALAELEGLTTPNAYGRFPLKRGANGEYDPAQPDVVEDGTYGYWDHVDFIVDKAAEYGIYIALLPTWGDKYNLAWGKGPVVFTKDNARAFGLWIGERYKSKANVVWVLGGDRPLETRHHFEVVHAMAEAIREADEGLHPMTFHPAGGRSSSMYVHDEEWLDFNMIQSGHGALHTANYDMVAKDYALSKTKPTLDGEPCFEDHPVGFKASNGYFDAADVRKAAYWALFSGAFGHTYGHHSIWSMTREPADYFIMDWKQALLRPGAAQMRHVRTLMESRSAASRVPDPSLLAANYDGANRLAACRGDGYAFVYSPNGLPFRVRLGAISGERVVATWFDPRTGATVPAGESANEGELEARPPSSGRNEDWVLMLDDASRGYAIP